MRKVQEGVLEAIVWPAVRIKSVRSGSYPPPPLHSNRLHAMVSSHSRGNTPQMTVPPPIIIQRARDTKQDMLTQGHMNHNMSQKLPIGIHVQLYWETGSVCHFFWREYLTLKSCTCSTGVTGMGSPAAGWAAGLAATWAAGLAALLVEALARGLVALGAGLAGGSSPCGKQFASGTSRMKYDFLLAKTFASPHTPRALFAHTISVSDALSHCPN